MEERDTIDLRQVGDVIVQQKRKLIAIITITTLLAIVIAFLLPKQYESSVLVRAKAQRQGGGVSLQAAAAVALLGGASSSPVQGYMEILKSRSVLDPVIAKIDLPPEEKKFMDNKAFVKSYLKLQNAKSTDLIEITATGRSPEEAKQSMDQNKILQRTERRVPVLMAVLGQHT